MSRTTRRGFAVLVVFLITGVLGEAIASTQQTEFERFKEYILNPEFIAIESVEAALMQTAAGQITTQARGYLAAASAPGSFVVTLVDGAWTQLTSLGPIVTERGRTTSLTPPQIKELRPRRFSLGLYYSYADFTQFDGKDISTLFKGPVVSDVKTVSVAGYGQDVERDPKFLEKLENDPQWVMDFQNALKSPPYDDAMELGRTAGIRVFQGKNRELVEVKWIGRGIDTLKFEETHEHLKQVARATFQIKTHTVTALANFVANKWLDLTALVPVHSIDWESDVFREYYVDGVLRESSQAHFGDSATGVGDITLRSKARLTREGAAVDCAAALCLRLPTGDEDEFLGTGSVGVNPLLMMSKELGRFAPYLNVGYLYDTENSNWSRWELKAALDFTPIPGRLTIGGEFIGFIYDDFNIYDAGVAVKFAPLRARPLALGASVLFPVNDDGLRPDYVGIFGAEYSF